VDVKIVELVLHVQLTIIGREIAMNVIAGQDLRASDNLYFLNTSSRVLLP